MLSSGQFVRKNTRIALIGGALLGVSTAARATLLAYEGFDYDNSTNILVGANGGTGWDSGWGNLTGSPNINTPYLTIDDTSITQNPNPFVPIGDRISKTGATAGHTNFSTAGRLFEAAGSGLNMGTDGTLYVSFSWTKTDNGSSGDNFEFQLNDSSTNTLVLRGGVTSSENHFLNQTTAVASGDQYGAIAQSTKYFTVLKITASAAGQDMIQAINYTALPPTIEPGAWDKTANITTANTVNVNQFRLIMGLNTTAQFDELRIGTAWADVADPSAVPEPASLGLIGLGLLAMLRRRRVG